MEKWIHIGRVYGATNCYFIDGVAQKRLPRKLKKKLLKGVKFKGAESVAFWRKGDKIANVSIYSRRLNDEEAILLHNYGSGLSFQELEKPSVNLKENLISFWGMDESIGVRVDKHSSNDLN